MFLAFWINSFRICCRWDRADLSHRESTPLSSANERIGDIAN